VVAELPLRGVYVTVGDAFDGRGDVHLDALEQLTDDVPAAGAAGVVTLVAHFQHVAARSPVPLITYNVPYRTGQELSAASLLELASTDNIAGVTQAVGGIDAGTLTVLAQAPEGFAVLGGDDPYLFPLTLMGAPGAIAASANLYTQHAEGRIPTADVRMPLSNASATAVKQALAARPV
jgi:4-hydroxy-tetrahydrodipicolinate synthase